MRTATAAERRRHVALALDDLAYLVPPWVWEKSSAHFPPDAKYYLPQVEWEGENVCIRGINRDTHEVLIDCGFDRVYWIGEGDPAPALQWIAYEPSDAERQRRRAERRGRERSRRIRYA